MFIFQVMFKNRMYQMHWHRTTKKFKVFLEFLTLYDVLVGINPVSSKEQINGQP